LRVRVWISGAEGPSHDFELVEAPRVGERVVVGVGAETEEGIVTAVTWQLQAIDLPTGDLPLAVEPLGAVTMVHVICRPVGTPEQIAAASAEIDAGALGPAH
jgi:hypothetical protein